MQMKNRLIKTIKRVISTLTLIFKNILEEKWDRHGCNK